MNLKIIRNEKLNKHVVFILFIFISVIMSAGAAKAEDMSWHKPVPCIGCHFETIGASTGKEECFSCHDYGLNVGRLESEHNPKICKACHMGNTLVNASEKEIFHNGHNAVNCSTCHTEDNFTVIKIKNNGFECVSCHSTNVHSIHIKNLYKACPICHGSWATGKTYISNSGTNTSKQNSDLEKFTIFAFIKNLIYAILGDFNKK